MSAPPASELQAVRALMRRDRARGLAALNDLFRTGRAPDPLPAGRCAGQLLAVDIAPGLTQLASAIAAAWMPWQGKTFDSAHTRGDNIFTRDSLLLARVFNPFYRGFIADGPRTYRAFAFRTYIAPGLQDPDRQVLKIDYDLRANPALTIRRVLDELVQVDEATYVGKAHMYWWWGAWQRVAFFSLTRPN
jgi:hypothetical protein